MQIRRGSIVVQVEYRNVGGELGVVQGELTRIRPKLFEVVTPTARYQIPRHLAVMRGLERVILK